MSEKPKKIWFVIGTAGELIKVYPVMVLLSRKGVRWGLIHTGQSGHNFWKQWDQFGLSRSADVVRLSERETDLVSSKGAGRWFFNFLLTAKEQVLSQKGPSPEKGDFFIVHGDTLSTLAGAVLGWHLSCQLFHIEAGLRSDSLLEPFPEEINRRLTSLLVDVHFPPDQTAADNLLFSGTSGRIVSSGANTLLDAIRLANQRQVEPADSKYVIANLHRFENLSEPSRWRRLIETTLKAQEQFPVVFAMHPPTQQKLEEDPESKSLLIEAGVELRERIPFFEFVHLLHGAQFVISDGGSNQEECFYLGVPCLILRETTERTEGLGENAVLSKMDSFLIDQFLSDHAAYKRPPVSESIRPSEVIVETLLSNLG